MLFLFWGLSTLLIGIAFLFVLPGLSGQYKKGCFILLFLMLVFPLYFKWGGNHYLKEFYSEEGKKIRLQQDKMRPLFAELKKQQGRLRLKLIENPGDILAKALLLELMGVEALHRDDGTLALRFWEAALVLLPKTQETEFIRNRIMGLKEHVALSMRS